MTANPQHPWGRCTECKHGKRGSTCSRHHSTRLVPYSGHLRRCGGYEQARAKIRLADEYDAAQERGEVATQADGRRSQTEHLKPTAADIGLLRLHCFRCQHFIRLGSLCGAYQAPTFATLDATDCPARNGTVPIPELKNQRERRCRN